MAPRKLAAGNWKMNGTTASLAEVEALQPATGCAVLVCPPATLIAAMAAGAQARAGAVQIGGQDCHAKASGAHTGDISAAQLADAGASHVIVGHSERRADHGETDAIVAAKARAAHEAGLVAVICLGETQEQHHAGLTLDVIATQMFGSVPETATAANTVIAYEPIWAIGSGRIPTTAQIAAVHALLRRELVEKLPDGAEVTLLYGGSVKPDNAAEIFAVENVDGALVGGASLKAADFNPIIAALSAS